MVLQDKQVTAWTEQPLKVSFAPLCNNPETIKKKEIAASEHLDRYYSKRTPKHVAPPVWMQVGVYNSIFPFPN